MNVATIPASLSFLDHIAQNWLQRVGLQGEKGHEIGGSVGTILVPGRRAARSLMEAFLRVLDGRAALLPSIVALGDVDGEVLFSMTLEEGLPPAVEPTRRLSILAQLIIRAPLFHMAEGQDDGGTIERVWPLAKALADLMDEAERCGVSLGDRLPDAVADDFSEHWQKTLLFLKIITEFWPQWLEEEGLTNIVSRQVALLQAQADAWHAQPPQHPVWAVGFVDGSAGISTVLEAVAALPYGVVVFQGVDCALPEALWNILPKTHPQALFREFFSRTKMARTEIEVWGTPYRPGRESLVRDVLLPEEGISRWGETSIEYNTEGISVLSAADAQQEAQSIALILRDVASSPGRSGALVTPDRALAQRVRHELLRFGIHADDSAGEPLARTPSAVFLRLIVAAVTANFAPVALLSMIKHPLASLGMKAGQCRRLARLLERVVLRGPAPPPGIEGIRSALVAAYNVGEDLSSLEEELMAFLERLEEALAPMLAFQHAAPLPDLLEALVITAESLAAVEDDDTIEKDSRLGVRLWQGDDGALLSQHLVELMTYTKDLPAQSMWAVEGFLTVSMAGKSLTGLRGHQDGVELAHPRISIYGILEARLLAFDTVVLGGLNEAVWPPAPDAGPWMSRPMRKRVGLFSPERQIGASAHDFAMSVLASDKVVLSRSLHRDGGPAVPARWLVRLGAFLSGRPHEEGLPEHPALAWQSLLDRPIGEACPVRPPEPCPPVALRPRRLSITAVDVLKTDPYAIYARYILRLKALSPLEEGVEYADYGMIVHKALERMFHHYPQTWPKTAKAQLRQYFDDALDEAKLRPALWAWWRPRLYRIADWVISQEAVRLREECSSVMSYTEVVTRYHFPDLPGGAFELTGRADRIDLTSEPTSEGEPSARVYDYKTGAPPESKEVVSGWSSQMVLEAALQKNGAFVGVPSAEVVQLLYWQLNGGETPGKVKKVPSSRSKIALSDLVNNALEQLRGLLSDYDNDLRPYRSQPWAGREPRYTDYAQLARVQEWRLTDVEEEG